MDTPRRNSSKSPTAVTTVGAPTLSKRLMAGVVGGLAGGAVFGILMAMMGMLAMVAALVGSQSAPVGFAVHLAISILIGLGLTVPFAGMLTGYMRAAVIGLVYGALWWVLGPLLLMPAMMGMPVLMINAGAWMSLLGHLFYGIILGVTAAAIFRKRA